MASRRIVKFLFLLISVYFYASYGLINLLFLSFSLISSFFLALLMRQKNKKILLFIGILLNLIPYLYFQINLSNYLSLSNVLTFLAPLGISYYTLQVISYLVDVYKEKYHAEKNFLNYALYLFYFPCIFIGPIHRYQQFNEAFNKQKFSLHNFITGSIRVLFGLFKKLVIAGRASILLAGLVATNEGGAYAFSAMLLYSILLYTDFSGGIDIVLGFSKMLGINLQENFDRPYFTESIKDFWNSWHISLSRWLKDYIYIPLGGNRVGKVRHKINVIITFLVSGFWHGMNYLVWGIFHGIFVAFPNLLKTKSKYINRFITILIVSILWAFFIYPDTFTSIKMIVSIFTEFNYDVFFRNFFTYGLNLINFIILTISSILLFLYESKRELIHEKIKKSSFDIELEVVLIGSLALIVLVFGIYGIGFEVEEFIYSRF